MKNVLIQTGNTANDDPNRSVYTLVIQKKLGEFQTYKEDGKQIFDFLNSVMCGMSLEALRALLNQRLSTSYGDRMREKQKTKGTE
jgi:hypothetical protein